MTDHIQAKIAKAIADIPRLEKNKVNKHLGTSYADIDALTEAVNPAFSKQGLFITQIQDSATQDGDAVFRLETIVYDSAGANFSFGYTPWFPASDNFHKMGTAITYARRYGYQTALNLSAEDDDGQLLIDANTDWATTEQVESLQKMVRDSYEKESDGKEALERWTEYMVQSGMMKNGKIPKDKYANALQITKQQAKNLESKRTKPKKGESE